MHAWKATEDADFHLMSESTRERESVRVVGERRRAFPFFLHKGRLGTSKKQGNHDNQTTNLGNQPSVLTVRARQAAQ